eukprot:TRINITY_DN10124_c0_g1_i1.p1 TRINITY_DN10124_c0_g1~~TRINITY_DN10124_c0_g1_i1.p1  ORF type:complete len:227 (+),score=35.09 TRINITY_DN10124_c0_g1_i1:443-1123(+)
MRLTEEGKLEMELEQAISEEINDFEIVEGPKGTIYCAHESGEVSAKSICDFHTLSRKQVASAGILSLRFCAKRQQVFAGDDTGLIHVLSRDLEYVKSIGSKSKDCITSISLDSGSTWLWTGGTEGVSQWHIDTGSLLKLYPTVSPVNDFCYQTSTNELLIVANDRYVVKYNRAESNQGCISTMSQTNFCLTCVTMSPGIELLLIGGDGKGVFAFINNVWLIAILLL